MVSPFIKIGLFWLCLSTFAFAQLPGDPPAPAAPAPNPSPQAELICPNAQVFGSALINKMCWSCLFPVNMFGRTVFSGYNTPPSDAASDVACLCNVQGALPVAGFTVGAWFPAYIIEVVRKPYCFPTMFGLDRGDATVYNTAANMGLHSGVHGDDSVNKDDFYSWHFYAFPLMQMLDLVKLPSCLPSGMQNFDVMFMSEVLPNWYDEELAFIVQPEALMFANPAASAAQFADCAAATVGNPLEQLFWTAGCWGMHYPMTGEVGDNSGVTSASLAMARAMYLISRLGFLQRTTGNDVVCQPALAAVVTKQQYKFQQLFPVAESTSVPTAPPPTPMPINTANAGSSPNATDPNVSANNQVPAINMQDIGKTCCHSYGQSSLTWGEWRNRPGKQDYVYVVWRWTDCCVGIIGGNP